MAEVQKCAPAVTADGADADPALLPIAGRTHAHMHTHRALFTHAHMHSAYSQTTVQCSHAQIKLHTHRPHAQMQRLDNSQ